jgi:hypothetical protein
MSETKKLDAPSGVGVDVLVRGCAKRIIARIDGITSAGGLALALEQLQRKAESDPYMMGPGETYAGVSLELVRDNEDGKYEIEFRSDP